MYTYYLCDDNETIYQIELSLKPEDKEHYLSLLENYLSELVFVEESTLKKLVNEKEIEKENIDRVTVEEGLISLEKKAVVNTEKLEDYLPFLVTVKTRKWFFLRSYTISILVRLLSKELARINSSYAKQILESLSFSNYLHFDLLGKNFFDEAGNINIEKGQDYQSCISLLNVLEVSVTQKYSKVALASFWEGDEADRCVAEGIVSDSENNKIFMQKLNYRPIQK